MKSNTLVNKTYIYLALTLMAITIVLLTIHLVQKFGVTWAVVASYSMEPILEPGDIVVIVKIDKVSKNLIGKVIVYREEMTNQLIVHRVISIIPKSPYCRGKTQLITKGDANLRVDPWIVCEDDVIGEVVLVIPTLGIVSLMFKNPLLLTLIIILTMILCTLAKVTTLKKEL